MRPGLIDPFPAQQAYYRQKDNGGFVKILTAATDPGMETSIE
jgi:hypothetical protein